MQKFSGGITAIDAFIEIALTWENMTSREMGRWAFIAEADIASS